MPKDLPISNGNLLLNFDADYRLRDIYFPHVGQEITPKGIRPVLVYGPTGTSPYRPPAHRPWRTVNPGCSG